MKLNRNLTHVDTFHIPYSRESLFIKNLYHSKITCDSVNVNAGLFEAQGDKVNWYHAIEENYMFSSHIIHAGYVVGFNRCDRIDKKVLYDVWFNEKGCALYNTSRIAMYERNLLFPNQESIDIIGLPEKGGVYESIFDKKLPEFHEPEMLSISLLYQGMYALQSAVPKFSIRKHRSHDFLVPIVSRKIERIGTEFRVFAWAIFSHYYSVNAHARNLIKSPKIVTCFD